MNTYIIEFYTKEHQKKSISYQSLDFLNQSELKNRLYKYLKDAYLITNIERIGA